LEAAPGIALRGHQLSDLDDREKIADAMLAAA
jgi:hypothetical protein